VASRTVLSAACSTAFGYGAGLGDRLGLGPALRAAGTTALVAPFWNVVAVDALAVLTETAHRYLSGTPLAEALRSAAADAVPVGPDWMVWALALEGDFR
jgi:CHAT domain-containing protein